MNEESITRNIAERLNHIPETDDFNKEKEFDSEILPKLLELKRLCNRARIPFFFTACVGNKKDKSTYRSTMISPMEFPTRLNLYDDKISKCLGIMIGFDSVYPQKDVEINVEEEINSAKNDFIKKLENELYVSKTYFEGNEKPEVKEEIKPENITANIIHVSHAPANSEPKIINNAVNVQPVEKPLEKKKENVPIGARKRGRPQKNDDRTILIRNTALDLIRTNKATTINDMLRITDFEEKELKAVLVKLKKDGIIQRMGAKKNGYWAVIGKVPDSGN